MNFSSLSHAVGEDYQQVSVVLTFGEDSERSCVQIELVNDTIFEGPENLTVVLTTMERVVTLVPDTATVTIQDDDGGCECTKLKTVWVQPSYIMHYTSISSCDSGV